MYRNENYKDNAHVYIIKKQNIAKRFYIQKAGRFSKI